MGYDEYIGTLDRLPIDFGKLDADDFEQLFGYAGLEMKPRVIEELLKKNRRISIPSTVVKNASLHVDLNSQGQLYCNDSLMEDTPLKEKAEKFAIDNWLEKLIEVKDIGSFCTMYLVNVADMQIVGRGYVGINFHLDWHEKRKEMEPKIIDGKINFLSTRKYAYEELRHAKFHFDFRNASFNVAYFCARCGNNMSTLGEECACGERFLYESRDFDICLSCHSGPFDFPLTQRMRSLFESNGWNFEKNS